MKKFLLCFLFLICVSCWEDEYDMGNGTIVVRQDKFLAAVLVPWIIALVCFCTGCGIKRKYAYPQGGIIQQHHIIAQPVSQPMPMQPIGMHPMGMQPMGMQPMQTMGMQTMGMQTTENQQFIMSPTPNMGMQGTFNQGQGMFPGQNNNMGQPVFVQGVKNF